MTDRMHIRDLEVACIIGTMPKERTAPQAVRLCITLECDLATAGRSDRIEDTVNYRDLKNELVAFLEQSRFFLIEKMADEVAQICLADPRVLAVDVTVDKPGALTSTRSVAVQIRRERG
jgi:D-erythro-7,8-dihydroneopterin triphosphate epimerase